ncbi:unnamed protein product, partial [Adineta steineri]
MSRKRPDNKKWRSRPSWRKPKTNRNTKPPSIRKNNSKRSPQKPKKINLNKSNSVLLMSREEQVTEETFDAR